MFLRYISHEIRTPLNIVHIGLELLWKDLSDPRISPAEHRKTVEEIRASIATAQDVLNCMLMYDTMENQMLVLECTDTTPLPLVKSCLAPFEIQVCLRVLSAVPLNVCRRHDWCGIVYVVHRRDKEM